MLPKPTRLEYFDCVFKVPRVYPSKQLACYIVAWLDGRGKKPSTILWKGISVVRLAGFLDHRGLKTCHGCY